MLIAEESDRKRREKQKKGYPPNWGGSYLNSDASGSCREAAELPTESTSIGDGFIPACGSHILTSSISLLSVSSGGAMQDGLGLGAADRSCGCCFLNFIFFFGRPRGRFCCCIRVGMVCALVSVWVKGISVLPTHFTCHFCFSSRFCSNLVIVASNLPHGELGPLAPPNSMYACG